MALTIVSSRARAEPCKGWSLTIVTVGPLSPPPFSPPPPPCSPPPHPTTRRSPVTPSTAKIPARRLPNTPTPFRPHNVNFSAGRAAPELSGRPAIEPPRLKRGNYCPARFFVSTPQPQLCFMVCCMLPFLTAGVAESVDAPDSKSGEGNLVWVRVPPPAHRKIPAKVQKTQSKAKGQYSNPGPFYTNYYTNALRQGVLHRFGSLALHVR